MNKIQDFLDTKIGSAIGVTVLGVIFGVLVFLGV